MKRTLVFTLLFAAFTITSCNPGSSENTKSLTFWDDSTKVERMGEIRSYSLDSLELPKDYFTDFGFRDWYRWPLIYPYSINSIDTREDGFLLIERGFKFVEGNQNEMDRIDLGRIKEFAFNEKALIARTGERQGKIIDFELFIFKTEEIRKFKSFSSMLKDAKECGFKQSDTLISLEQYNLIFH